MARDDGFHLAPIVVVRFKDAFQEVDYSLILNGPFEITNTLDTFQKEAGQKGCAVVVQIALLPLEEVFPPPTPESEELDSEPKPE